MTFETPLVFCKWKSREVCKRTMWSVTRVPPGLPSTFFKWKSREVCKRTMWSVTRVPLGLPSAFCKWKPCEVCKTMMWNVNEAPLHFHKFFSQVEVLVTLVETVMRCWVGFCTSGSCVIDCMGVLWGLSCKNVRKILKIIFF